MYFDSFSIFRYEHVACFNLTSELRDNLKKNCDSYDPYNEIKFISRLGSPERPPEMLPQEPWARVVRNSLRVNFTKFAAGEIHHKQKRISNSPAVMSLAPK
eukprot:GHVU01014804.1.p1 GENE.GHVU01014804.1~~GHVU01014804.1.p1  ORF type:complete len:101 (+),score=1.94 GHVU01014804.1:254-556(+)